MVLKLSQHYMYILYISLCTLSASQYRGRIQPLVGLQFHSLGMTVHPSRPCPM